MERIGGYGVVRKLGEGGMGMVWLARSRGGRLVAVKVARPELAGDEAFRERFRAEVAAARSVGGFHTAQVVDADPDADPPWLATAYVPGPTLARLLVERGPMDEKRLRGLGAALAEALQAIHRCGLVHRDLKPANIVMAEDGPRVLDFGIARALENTRLTVTGTAFGTPGFLAPEQAEGREVGPAADVFAFGAVLVAAAGGSAFGGGTPVALMYRSVHHEADLGAVPEPLRPLVAACLDKDPGRRPDPDRLLDWFSPPDGAEPGTASTSPAASTSPSAATGPADAVPEADSTPQAAATGPADATPPAGGTGGTESPGGTPAAVRPPLPPMPAYTPGAPGAPGPSAPPVQLPPSPYAPASPYSTRTPYVPAPGYGYPSAAHPPAAYPAPAHPAPGYPAAGYPAAPAGQLPPDAPEFLAMDRKNAVVADAEGISLGVNGVVKEFPWSAIDVAWCEKGTGRGHVLVVALALPDGSVHSCEVGTRRPDELEAWIGYFTALLGYYAPEDRPEG